MLALQSAIVWPPASEPPDMTTSVDLLSRGYFPKEIPPTFDTSDFANRTLGFIGQVPPSFLRSRRSRLCTHNYARVGQFRRVLGIPNPVVQYNLARVIAKKWKQIDRQIRRSRIVVSTPVADEVRALAPGNIDLPMHRALLRANAKYAVIADVARFYHSIYTHSIPWAIHSKATAKSNKGEKLFGNRIDRLLMDAQDGQTIGIPVGPDTSLVVAELLLAAVDRRLRKKAPRLRGLRFVDDYELVFRNRLGADRALEQLRLSLAHFELGLNPLKTRVIDLPAPHDEPWKAEIRRSRIAQTGTTQARDLMALFDTAFSLAAENPEKSVLAYTIGRLKNIDVRDDNWRLLQHLLLQCIHAEPTVVVAVLEKLAAQSESGQAIDTALLGGLLNDQIVEHAPLNHSNEVAWALWGALAFQLPLSQQAGNAVASHDDSVVALLALHAKKRNLFRRTLKTDLWTERMTGEELYGEQWLLSYEASVKGWLRSADGRDHVGADENFRWLRAIGVEFYDENKAVPLAPVGTPRAPWLEQLEAASAYRSRQYGVSDDDDDLSDDTPDF